jgi:N-acetylneuraminic acid mutarotase
MKQMKKLIVAFGLAFIMLSSVVAQKGWNQKNDFASLKRQAAVAFAIGEMGYFGTGNDGSTYYKDFWEYNPKTDTWTQKADYPGGVRGGAAGFAIGNYGYAGLGESALYDYEDDFYKYDPTTNTWSSIAKFPGLVVKKSFSFVLDGKGYVGCGKYATAPPYTYQMYAYDPSNDSWSRKADYPGIAGVGMISFEINNKGYAGTGNSGGNGKHDDFYEYDPNLNTWSRKADFPGNPIRHGWGFSIGEYGYAGVGHDGSVFYNTVYRYDPQTNSWTQITDFPGDGVIDKSSFTIGNSAYIIAGKGPISNANPIRESWRTQTVETTKQVWEYNASTVGTEEISSKSSEVVIYPNPASEFLYIQNNFDSELQFCLYDVNGRLFIMQTLSCNLNMLDIKSIPAGTYFVSVYDENQVVGTKKVLVR